MVNFYTAFVFVRLCLKQGIGWIANNSFSHMLSTEVTGMGKRTTFADETDFEKTRSKRQKLSNSAGAVTESAEDINSVEQLRTLLTFDQSAGSIVRQSRSTSPLESITELTFNRHTIFQALSRGNHIWRSRYRSLLQAGTTPQLPKIRNS